MFSAETPNLKEKLQKLEADDMREFGRNQGWTEEEIELCIHDTYLCGEIAHYRELLCEDEEILEVLLDRGFEQSEIEKMLKTV